jgi:hypothetical protein
LLTDPVEVRKRRGGNGLYRMELQIGGMVQDLRSQGQLFASIS